MRSESYYKLKLRHAQEEFELAEHEALWAKGAWQVFITFWRMMFADSRLGRAKEEYATCVRRKQNKLEKLKRTIRELE